MRRHPLVPTIAAVALTVTAIEMVSVAGLRINLTPSMPMGLWWRSTIVQRPEPGATVFACLPAEIGRQGVERGYLGRGIRCSGGAQEVLKVVSEPPVPIGVDAVWLEAPHPRSWDSRIFGPVPAAGITGTARPLLVWKEG